MPHLNTAFTVSPTEELHDTWIPPFSRQSARQTAYNHGKDAFGTLAMVGGRCANEFAESRFAPLSNPLPASGRRFFVLPQGQDRLQSRILGPSTAEICCRVGNFSKLSNAALILVLPSQILRHERAREPGLAFTPRAKSNCIRGPTETASFDEGSRT
ncbi:uncharacterized protein K444DRAFT_612159 [Hyaloscypha bicolor E]|jgi:hypothetical protein|uniref:Uncharacterized protein n=1 Tax=Hyaloscypha bicolor E TaxID=1095630 RepID=A0A2J6TCX1_9HELO|nr:uncharacterized protein K444DRAFT_612159 [Hyaloscypha bicolor E]PMD60884.1 hypothetical protein K444DRAFT_612159 [Hyaloscypha bicolor E]